MRDQSFEDPEYIVRLVKQLVGENVLAGLWVGMRMDFSQVFAIIGPCLQTKVRKMNSATLGRICECSRPSNFSAPLCSWSGGFIRMTGLGDVCSDFSSKKSGRELLEEIAVATLVSVAYDFIRQRDYKFERQVEIAQEEEFDRGMSDYIHHGPKDHGA